MSDTAPSVYSIWLRNGKLYYYNNGTWVEITTAAVSAPAVENLESNNTKDE